MVRVNFTGDYGPNLQLDLFSAWSSPIEGKNASLVNVQVILIANGYAAIYGSYPRTLWVNVGGIQEQVTVDVGISQGQVKPLLQKNYEIPHNADGTKSINISTAIDINIGGYGVARAAFDLQLQNIARASKGGDVSATIGSPVNLTINRASDAFFHSIYVEYGTWKRSITGNTVTTNYNWTPPMELCEQTPDSIKGEGSITYITYQNGREIGRDVRRLTLTVPDSVRPSITSITVKDTNEKIAKFMKPNTFVTILSNLKVDFGSATGAYGSTITKYNAFIVDKPYSAYTEEGIIGNVHYVGRAIVRATVTDSRGRVSEPKDIPVEFIDYYLPQISFDVKRIGPNADQLQVTRNVKINPLTVDGKQKNTMKVSFKVAQFGTEAFIDDTGPANLNATDKLSSMVNSVANLGGRYFADRSYIVIGTIEDNFASASYRVEVATRSVVMSMDQSGIGINKVRERGALDVGGDIYANNKPIQQHQLTQNTGVAHYRYNINLDDEKVAGIYFKNGTELNNPAKQYGFLIVLKSNNEVFQLFFPTIDTAPPFKRTFFRNKWTAWSPFNMGENTPSKPVEPPASTSVKKDIAFPWLFTVSAHRIGNVVTLNLNRTAQTITSQYENVTMRETIPEGFRPATDSNMIITANERHNIIGSSIFHLLSTGIINMTSGITQTAIWTGTITYLTEDPMPK
jgi:ORF46|nr:MAG TPA: protein of unknown function DUF859 [Caudoviricetes sp.]